MVINSYFVIMQHNAICKNIFRPSDVMVILCEYDPMFLIDLWNFRN